MSDGESLRRWTACGLCHAVRGGPIGTVGGVTGLAALRPRAGGRSPRTAKGRRLQHRDRTTKTPYLAHLLAVSSLVWENGGDEEDAIAGLLHDAIEDTDATAADIEERSGRMSPACAGW